MLGPDGGNKIREQEGGEGGGDHLCHEGAHPLTPRLSYVFLYIF